MKKKISFFILSLLFVFTLTLQPLAVQASPANTTVTREYLPDGSYYETVLETIQVRSTVNNARKTLTYKNSSGKSLWYVTVTADFSFNGSTSHCTSASATAGSYTSTYKISSKSSGRSGNSGWARATADAYSNGSYVSSMTRTVYIYCDKNGNVS